MRVFQVIEATSNAAVAGSSTWLRNLHEPLVELGHDVVLFSALEGRIAMQRHDLSARARFSERLLSAFRQEHVRRPISLLFAYLMDGMIEPEVIREISKLGVITCNFSCNNVHQFDLVDEISPRFDYNLHSEKDVAAKFRAVGATPLWWPMASNPKYFRPMAVERLPRVTFVGANYSLRARYLTHLLEAGINAHAYGPGWVRAGRTWLRSAVKQQLLSLKAACAVSPSAQYDAALRLEEHACKRALAARFPQHVHDPVSDDELIALYSSSELSLGILEVHEHHDPSLPVLKHLHLREFEAPMAGALYCTGYSDELAEMFEPDREVVVYREVGELVDKVRYYFSHPDAAGRVRTAGRARALRDHTYTRRFEQLFAALKLAA